MSYRSILRAVGGVQMGLWRPQAWGDGTVVLLLGRAADEWYGTTPSNHARKLVEAGYWVITVGTPNLGNQTDMDAIDDALAWAESFWSRDIGRIQILTHNDGAIAGLNWSLRHFERVAAISMISPIIDVAERYERLGAANGALTGLALPGTSGNYALTADYSNKTVLDVSGDIDIRIDIAPTDWTPASAQALIGKWNTSSQRSWKLQLATTGGLNFQYSTDGSNVIQHASTIAVPGVADGDRMAVRVTRNATTGEVDFYYAPNISGVWTQLGATVSGAAGTMHVGTGHLYVGIAGPGPGSEHFAGTVFAVDVRDGIDGTAVANPTFNKPGDQGLLDPAGQWWWLTGSSLRMKMLSSGGAETDAMEAVHGGTADSFADAMGIWNPGYSNKLYQLADYLNGRIHMWWSAADAETPDAVHTALAGLLRANTHSISDPDPLELDPANVISTATATDQSWTTQPGHQVFAKWLAYAKDTSSTSDWTTADGNDSIELPNGNVLWTFSDSGTSEWLPNDTFNSINPGVHNMFVLEDSSGNLVNTIQIDGDPANPALHPPGGGSSGDGSYYWLNSGMVENGSIYILGLKNAPGPPPFFFEIADRHVIQVDLNTFQLVSAHSLGYTADTYDIHWLGFLQEDDYTYIYGGKAYSFLKINQTHVARAPAGDITAPWEHWTGSGWSLDELDSVSMKDKDNNTVQIGGRVAKLSNGVYLWYGKGAAIYDMPMRLFTGPTPLGPWTHYMDYDMPEGGAARYGANTFTYEINYHPHMSTNDYIMMSYNVNWLGKPDYYANDRDIGIYRPKFVNLPLPPA